VKAAKACRSTATSSCARLQRGVERSVRVHREDPRALLLLVPLTIFIIFILMYASTRSAVKTGIIVLAVPFSLVGAFWLLYLLDSTCRSPCGRVDRPGRLDAETRRSHASLSRSVHKLWVDNGRLRTCGDLVQAIHHGAVSASVPN